MPLHWSKLSTEIQNRFTMNGLIKPWYYDKPLDDGWGIVEIEFDLYGLDSNDKKFKSGKKICRFAQPPNGGKSILPKILQKVLKARKDTRKKCEYITFNTHDGKKYTGLMKEKGDEYIINENNSGKIITLNKMPKNKFFIVYVFKL